MNKNTTPPDKTGRLRLRVLSDMLRAEIEGKPIDYARYCATYPSRINVFGNLMNDREIQQLPGGSWGVTFSGLLKLDTTLSSSVVSDCRAVYNVLRSHYKKHLHEGLPVHDIAKQLTRPRSMSRVLFAISILSRDSGANIGTGSQPVTESSRISGSQAMLEMSFSARVKQRRELMSRPAPSAGLMPAGAFGFAARGNFEGLFSSIGEFGSDEVQAAWSKSTERLAKDPEGAITAARTLLESSCKQILHVRSIKVDSMPRLQSLYKAVSKEIGLEVGTHDGPMVRQILQGCAAVIQGLAELRNALGDSHGKAPGSYAPSHRHARLAVALSGAMTAFLLASDNGRRIP